MGGGLYWPTQSFPLDYDVREYFGMDYPLVLVDVNQIFYPMFEVAGPRRRPRNRWSTRTSTASRGAS